MARRKVKDVDLAYYHCISRVLDHRLMGEEEKKHFIRLMHGYETFCGVRVVTFCVMYDHFHLLLEVPRRPAPERLPDDRELVRRAHKAQYSYRAAALRKDLTRCRKSGEESQAEELRELLFARMWDVSWFMKMLKQRFTQWYNKQNNRHGTLWEERYRSMPVCASGPSLASVAAHIDLNPVRHGIVQDAEAYPWSGYGEAVAGVREAREGLRVAIEARCGHPVVPQRVMSEYRQCLAEAMAEEAEKKRARSGKNGKNGKHRRPKLGIEALRNGRAELVAKAG